MAKRRANGEGSIRKRKDGRWEGRYIAGRDPGTGKPIYRNILIIPRIGKIPLEKLTTIQIQKFYNDLQKNGRI